MQKRRQFIINFLYFGIIFMLAFVLLKYGLPMVSPFAAGFVIACILRKPVLFLAEKLPLSQKAAAVLTVLLFYCTIGILFFSDRRQGLFRSQGLFLPASGALHVPRGTCPEQYLQRL